MAATHRYNKEKWIRLPNPTMGKPFPGQYFDGETGLHYNFYRDYEPGVGRYVQGDPVGLSGGLNVYLYSDANPIFTSDPLGLAPGQHFNSPSAAACDALKFILRTKLGKEQGWEWGGWVIELENGCYTYLEPITSELPDMIKKKKWEPKPKKAVAAYHTHPPLEGYDPGFSLSDEHFSYDHQVPLYLLDPAGDSSVFIPVKKPTGKRRKKFVYPKGHPSAITCP